MFSLISGDAAVHQERLRDLLNIKEGKAQSIQQKLMTDMIQKMMRDGGDSDDVQVLVLHHRRRAANI